MSKSTYYTENKQLVIKTTEPRQLPAGWIRVQPKAVAINPTDYKHLTTQVADGTSTGNDFAGVVIEIGEGVEDVKVGDTVAATAASGNHDMPDDGAFSTSVDLVPGAWLRIPNLVSDPRNKIPAGVPKSFEQASSMSIGVMTTAIAFAHYNKTPLIRNSKSGYALIYGAASSLGFQAVQFAKYLGYTVIAVASPKHYELLKSVGASHTLDYHEDWMSQAREIGGDDIIYAYDTIGFNETFQQIYKVVSSTKPAKINSSLWWLEKPEVEKPNVTYDAPLLYLLWMERKVWLDTVVEGFPELRQNRAAIYNDVTRMISEGALQAINIDVVAEGFENIPKLYEAFAKGTSGNKLVARL